MPIKGKMSAVPYTEHVAKMTVGQTAYINAKDLTVTRKAVFLDLVTPIILKEDFYDDLYEDHISITRKGKGISDQDFEIDLSDLENFDFTLEGRGMYNECMREKWKYVIFFNFTCRLKKDIAFPTVQEETIEMLQEKLQEALNESKFELAAQLRDKIESRQKK